MINTELSKAKEAGTVSRFVHGDIGREPTAPHNYAVRVYSKAYGDFIVVKSLVKAFMSNLARCAQLHLHSGITTRKHSTMWKLQLILPRGIIFCREYGEKFTSNLMLVCCKYQILLALML